MLLGMDQTGVLVALAMVPLTSFLYWFFLTWQARRSLPPGPLPLPFIGNMYLLREENIQKIVYDLSKTYGDVFTLWLGSKATVFVNSISPANEYLVKKGKLFAGRPQAKRTTLFRPKQSGILFADYHEIWQSNRKLTHGYFNPHGFHMEGIAKVLQDEAQHLIQNVHKMNGQPFYPKEIFLLTTLNIVMQLMFGEKHEIGDKGFNIVYKTLETINGISRRPLYIYILRKLPFYKESYSKELDWMHNYNAYLAERFAEIEETYNPKVIRHWADAMIKRHHEHEDDLRDQFVPCAFDLIGAGTDSSHNTLLWATLYLGLLPNVQERLYKHITGILGKDEVVAYNRKTDLPYLEAFVHEVLRFSCVTSFGQPHKVMNATTLNGFSVKPGVTIVTSAYSLHFDEKYWKNPHEFDIDRFINDKGEFRVPNESFLPFSAGMRACMGEQLARMDIFTMMGNLIKNFEFSFPSDVPKPTLEGQREISWAPRPYKIIAKCRMDT